MGRGGLLEHPTHCASASRTLPSNASKSDLGDFAGSLLPFYVFLNCPSSGAPAVRRNLSCLLLVCFALVQTGCVSRRITVKTVPPGALVEMNGERLGISPVSKSFTYYGTNEFKVSMPGYETVQVQQPTPAPWYQRPPLDFISDNFLPFRIRDHREFTYQLTPRNALQELDEQALRNRGENFRSQSQSGPIQ